MVIVSVAIVMTPAIYPVPAAAVLLLAAGLAFDMFTVIYLVATGMSERPPGF